MLVGAGNDVRVQNDGVLISSSYELDEPLTGRAFDAVNEFFTKMVQKMYDMK